MIGKCEIKTCSNRDIATKVCEEFEAVMHIVCWSCGDKIKEKLQPIQLQGFLEVIRAIEEGLE